MSITKLDVNGQEGILLLNKERVVGVYSHHNKAVIILMNKMDDQTIKLPKDLREYKLFKRVADSVSLQCWTSEGWLGIYDITKLYRSQGEKA